MAHSWRFLANKKARNGIVEAENLPKKNSRENIAHDISYCEAGLSD